MGIVIYAGLVFWMALAFLGTSHSYKNNSGPLYSLFLSIKSKSAVFLLITSLLLIAIALNFCSIEAESIRNEQGMIGLYFMMSVVSGIAGSISLSAYLYLDSN